MAPASTVQLLSIVASAIYRNALTQPSALSTGDRCLHIGSSALIRRPIPWVAAPESYLWAYMGLVAHVDGMVSENIMTQPVV